MNPLASILDSAGILFFYGFPQPTHEENAVRPMRDETRLPDGRTGADHRRDVRAVRNQYTFRSYAALILIVCGSVAQVIAVWC